MSYKGIPSFGLKFTLIGHTKPVNSLAVSGNGAFLLSGADDASIVIWSLESGEVYQKILTPFHGPTSIVAWTPMSDDSPTGNFAFGSADGSISVYQQGRGGGQTFDFASLTTAHGGPIEDLAFDPYLRRLASVGSGGLKIWDMDMTGQITLLRTTPPRPFILRSAAFFDRGKSIVVCYLESHEIVAYEIDPWSMKWSHQLPTRIGNAALSVDERTLIVSNLKDGIDTYSLPPRQPLRSFRHSISCNVPLSVCSTLDGALILAGSDDGYPRIYDQRLGTLSQTLPHSQGQCGCFFSHNILADYVWGIGSLVQAGYSRNGRCLLVTGSSDKQSTIEIKVWAESKVDSQTNEGTQQPAKHYLSFSIWQLLLVFFVSLMMQVLVSRIPKKADAINTLLNAVAGYILPRN
ncbi:Vegetative incompatibility protein HET-E-1 [Hypsizygus marmoreus]|uniref:Vegetative incompatibility protein HET-E-1 n=1 Tax=Hypsizygus marmoreus TaxID=39966 RepID=A0A369K6P1_HYPMA|nr:Vegetative incompatibility protein HET-E-1 [Hypsizygus marmoreus]